MSLAAQYQSLVVETCPETRKTHSGQPCQFLALNPRMGGLDYYEALHLPFLRKYSEWYAGTSRITYIDRVRNVVYKVPLTLRGEEGNHSDAQMYELQLKGFGRKKKNPIAPCRMVNDVVLEMELLEPLDEDSDQIPSSFTPSDGYQVGRRKSGELVFFDL